MGDGEESNGPKSRYGNVNRALDTTATVGIKTFPTDHIVPRLGPRIARFFFQGSSQGTRKLP